MNKEATLVLLDVGASMYERFEGASADTRRLDVAVDCLKLMLQNKIFNHKNHEVGLILFGSDEGDDQTIYVREIQTPDLDFIRNVGELGEHEVPQHIGGDVFDALDKAVNTIDEYVGTKKIAKKIFVITSGCGDSEYKDKELQQLVKSIRRSGVKINLVAIDFMDDYDPEKDDPESDTHQDIKTKMFAGSQKHTPTQNLNQRMLYVLQEELRGIMGIFPAQVAFELYSQFRTRQVSARASFRGEFQISMRHSIQVMIYKKTTEEKIPSLKKYSTLAPYNQEVGTNEVKNDSVFYIIDDASMTPVDKENIIKGYPYGRSVVPIDSIMEDKMKLKCPRQFTLLGFVERHQVPRHYYMSSVDMVVPVDSEKAKKQMSALITALIATKKAAVARFVGRDKGSPKLVVLLPHKNENYECFWMIGLPTVEDIRNFQFTSLKKATPVQQSAVAQMIDAMDLTNIVDDDGQPQELLKMKHVVNPTRQYFHQVVMHKAITLTDVIPPISEVITDYLRPEDRVNRNARSELERVKQVFKFKKNEIKKVGEKKVFWKQLFEQEQPVQEEEVQVIDQQTEEITEMVKAQKFGFYNEAEIREIGSINPIEDFKKMVSNKKADLVDLAIAQMQNVIRRFIEESIQGSHHAKALECLKVMRQACIDEAEAAAFNTFLHILKERFSAGPQDLFWANLVKEGITLITQTEHKDSLVSVDEALDFLRAAEFQVQHIVDKLQNEEEDLLAEIE